MTTTKTKTKTTKSEITMKTYTIHGTRDDYSKVGGVPCMDSEGNIFPTMAACARYHGVPRSTMDRNDNVRPVKSKTLDKKICATTIYIDEDILFDPDQSRLVEYLATQEMVFRDYIFKGIPAIPNADGTVTKGMRIHDGNWVFSDFDHWKKVNDWVKRGCPMNELFGR